MTSPRRSRLSPARWLLACALAGVLAVSALQAAAAAGEKRHGLSAFGDLRYPADFTHFDYVNPDAPKGGRLSMIGTAGRITFNSLNGYILRGDPAQGLAFLFDSLMTRAQDEPDAVYGLVAQSVELAEGREWAIFHLRPEARFSDGTPVTAEDVAFSFNILKEKGHPSYGLQLKDVTKVEALDARTVKYHFTGSRLRDLPLTVAQLPIFSKAYYAGRDFSDTSMEPPLGSGPYAVADFKQGRYITYRRRTDYWGRDLAVNRGRFNFDELRYEYFRDRTAEFEALKAGEFDLREEFTSRNWATAYEIDQVRSGRLIRLTLPDKRPSGTQGFFLNTRRPLFKDVRMRKAFDLAFDFEWTNRTMFYGLYKRTGSYFENSDMRAVGAPSGAELALLEPYRDKLPKEVFEPVYVPPQTNGSGQDRRNLRLASRLMRAAGYTIKDGKRVDPNGKPVSVEFLIFSPGFERIIAPYRRNLELLGLEVKIRRVDPAQYEQRVKSFDFDIVTRRYVMRMTPGNELRNYWSSDAAKAIGAFNLSGIADPVVDALIDKVIGAKNREDMQVAARALDRVLRAGHYWVSHWYKAAHNIAHWDKFGRPSKKPAYARGIIDLWWYDEDKAAALKADRTAGR